MVVDYDSRSKIEKTGIVKGIANGVDGIIKYPIVGNIQLITKDQLVKVEVSDAVANIHSRTYYPLFSQLYFVAIKYTDVSRPKVSRSCLIG